MKSPVSPPAPPKAPVPGDLSAGAALPDWLALTVRYVSELQYGQVTLTIHQGAVIEVQKTERTRLSPGRRG